MVFVILFDTKTAYISAFIIRNFVFKCNIIDGFTMLTVVTALQILIY